ncbi:MAG TPA: L-seryl-tRNA(Sec) selenium transferase [Thermodesulfobacteriota bacterium]|nr:L-seryl-tRNA(Sec) selenium transferase [Thermodesulfobacteriota bacterium]
MALKKKRTELRNIPSVDELVRSEALSGAVTRYSAPLVTDAAREVLERVRSDVLAGGREFALEELPGLVIEYIEGILAGGIKRVVNATGTILHTNLGRAVLAEEALDAVMTAGGSYTNLEFDLGEGRRGERDSHVEGLLKRLTGAESACVVNNNAAGVLLALNTLAEEREVVISRGELIEIGGSFRLPEIIKKSGCILKEVGTTNRTHPADYEKAVGENTALLLKAHRSNYTVVGFTSEVGLKDLVDIGRKHALPVVEDLGSGSLVDLTEYGLPREPVVRESVEAGADLVTFSGDKLLGGPQAGIIVGKKAIMDRVRTNPLKRALRADKLTLAALQATLKLYLNRDKLPERLPTLKVMTTEMGEIEEKAKRACALLKKRLGSSFKVIVEEGESVVGGGSLPGRSLPTRVVAVTHEEMKPERIYRLFLENDPPILGRISRERFLLDLRTVERPEDVVPGGPF